MCDIFYIFQATKSPIAINNNLFAENRNDTDTWDTEIWKRMKKFTYQKL